MSAYQLSSRLAGPIANLIRLRRLSGSDYASQTRLLELFDRFLVQQGVTETHPSRETVEAYQQSLAGLAPGSRSNHHSVVRQLCRHLAGADPAAYIPEPFRTPRGPEPRSPYIFSRGEIRALMTAASKLPPLGSMKPETHRTLLGLLYSTGIRVGEALALNIGDFLPVEQRFLVAEGKFRKARWIPLTDSACRALRSYLKRRRGETPRSADAPLLLNERSGRLRYPTLNRTFRNLLEDCGIGWDRRNGPRIHDIRHNRRRLDRSAPPSSRRVAALL